MIKLNNNILIFKIINLSLLLFIYGFLWSKPIVQSNHLNIIIDTDCAIDDMRAISILLCSPTINIKLIIVCDGTLSPTVGAKKVKALLHFFNKDSIAVICGKELNNFSPSWRGFNEQIAWAPAIKESPCLQRQEGLKNIMDSLTNVTLICLGPLTNVNIFKPADRNFGITIKKIIWYNDCLNPLHGFNYDYDKSAAEKIINSNIRVDVISNLDSNEVLYDTGFYNATSLNRTAIASALNYVHNQKEVLQLLKQRHFKLCDELVAIYLTNPELFDMEPMLEKFNIRYNIDYDRIAVKEVFMDIIKGDYSSQKNVVFNAFPVRKENYSYDVRQIMDSAISRYGNDEWKACVLTDEFHGHLGVYSIVGAKMGIRAREYFGVGADVLEVISYAGITPPYSCLNDGIQVSTGATLGQGTIFISSDEIHFPMAQFSYRDKSIKISLKEQYNKKVDFDISKGIKQYGLMDEGYWKLVRRSALRYWVEWDRNKIFNIEEIKQ